MNDKEKALFFAQHLGQKVFTHKDWECFNDKSLMEVDPTHLQCGSNRLASGYLLLRSVNQLTDEEKSLITEAYYQDGRNERATAEYINSCFLIAIDFGKIIPPLIYQLLLRLGILLPFTFLDETNKPKTLQPDEIIALGWAKLKTT